MDKIKDFLSAAGAYLKKRGLGFWLLAGAALISIIMPFVYLAGFKTTYFSGIVMALSFLAVSGLAASLFAPTQRYAGLISFAFIFATLLVFIKTSYMYLTGAFFGGISGNILVQAGFHYSFCIIALLTGLALSAASVFLRQTKRSVKPVKVEESGGREPSSEQNEVNL